ncbi:MAG: zinc ribbon domain-containing protein [Acidobacteriota bacterium]
MLLDCPKCGEPVAPLDRVCAACGASQALGAADASTTLDAEEEGTLYRAPPSAASSSELFRSAAKSSETGSRSLEPAARRAVVQGVLLAAALFAFPFTRFVFSYLTIISHELGHAGAHWFFGEPAVPTLDFLAGGGVTFPFGQSKALLVLAAAGYLSLAVLWREHRKALLVLAVVASAHLALALSPAHRAVTVAMGHGGSMLAAMLCFYRVLDGNALKTPLERPLYAFVGAFLTFGELSLHGGLVLSQARRNQYVIDARAIKGMDMDLVILSRDFFRIDLVPVAFAFVLASLFPVVAAWWLHLNGQRIADALHRLFDG